MLSKENIKNIYTLSPMQEGMYFHSLYDKSSFAYFEQMSYHLHGDLNIDFVKSSIDELFKRYDILRTVFVEKKAGKILQVVLKEREVDFQYRDISSMEDKDSYVREFKAEDKKRSFDLNKDVLMRVAVIKTEADEYEFIWSHHHILMDGWCVGIMISEFFEIYTAFLQKRPYKLAPVTPYVDYIQWLEKQDRKVSKNYWQDYLAGYEEAVGLPRKKLSKDEDAGFKEEKVAFKIDPETTALLNRLAAKEQVTLNTIIQTVWGIILCKYNSRTDVVFGAVVSGRPAEIENVAAMVGLFINTVPVRIDFSENRPFSSLLLKVQKEYAASERHHYFPLHEIQSLSILKQNLLDHIIVFQNFPVAEQITAVNSETGANKNSAPLRVADVESFEQTNYDFMLMVRSGDRLWLRFDYNGFVYENDLIERMARHFMRVLEQVSVDGEIKVGDIRFISEEEKKQLIYEFNDTSTEYPRDTNIYRLFSEQAERTPENIALLSREQIESEADEEGALISLKYREFKQMCDNLASFLVEKGVQPCGIIGIMAHRSVEMVVGIFAILAAGGAYLPIDPGYPAERKRYLLKDSGAKLLLTTHRLYEEENLSSLKVDTIFIEEAADSRGVTHYAVPDGLAYVIYTSGSTGKPKGVMVEHRSVINLIYTLQDLYPLRESDAFLFKTSYLFDVSVAELFGWFPGGGKLAVLVKGGEREPETILTATAEAGVTHINFVPTMFSVFIDELNPGNKNKLSGLKYIFLAGETLLTGPVKKFRELNTDIVLENIYGPTEATVYASKYSLSQWDGQGNIPIGKPLANMSNIIVDESGFLQPVYIHGELYISGTGLARGYLNRPELTAEKFITGCRLQDSEFRMNSNSDITYQSDRFYKTGDLVCRMPDGNIEFSGRMDFQVKVRGFRIELGEIENCLHSQEGIEEVVVLAKERIAGDEQGDKYLCAYIVPGSELSIPALREALAQRLPEYMIPSYFFSIDKIPLTGSGKIDRRALPDPDESLLGEMVEYAAPRTELEKILVETWGRVLNREKPGIHENFFMIGGDSIKSIQIASAMKNTGYRVEVKDIFRNPTIAGLTPHVRKVTRQPIQGTITGEVPLSPIQNRFLEIVDVENHHYNQSVMLQSKKRFSADILHDVFAKLQEHHDAMRMTYRKENDKIIQTNHGRDYPLSLSVFNLRDLPDPIEQLKKEAEKIQASIDLEMGPMMKVALFQLADSDRLLVVIHHLVIDGVSWRILFEDIETLYSQREQGESFSLPLKSDSFKLWAEGLEQYANDKSFLQEKSYWANIELSEIPEIRKDFENAVGTIKQSAQRSLMLSSEETELLLTKVNVAFGTEINDILLTALALAFNRTFSVERVLLGLEGHGREEILQDIDVNRTIGWFTSLYPVILEVSNIDNLSLQIKEIKENLRRLPNKGIGYGILKYLTAADNKQDIVFKLDPRISFNYLGQFGKEVETKTFGIAKESPGINRSAKGEREFDLDISGMIVGDRLSMSIVYDIKQFKVETMQSLLENYRTSLSRIIEFCSCRQERELTPSDLAYKKLTIETLERLRSIYPNLIDIYRLTPMQEGMLFHAIYGDEAGQKNSAAYFEQMSYRFLGDLDVSYVEKSLNLLFERHDILRTAFVHENVDHPLQVVLRERTVDFQYEDLVTTGSLQDREAYIKEFKKKDRQRYFDLSQDVLMRTAILRVDKSEYEFTWSFHHILMDGWCIGVLNAEFFEIYSSYLENREFCLPAVKPYKNYIEWLENKDKEVSKEYWRKYLDNYEEAAVIPHSKGSGKIDTRYTIDHLSFIWEKEETNRLKKLAVRYQITLNTLFQTIWGIVLGNYNGKRDVVFGAVVSGRPPEIEGIESMLGLFINTIPVRISFEKKDKLSDLMRRVQEEAIESEQHHFSPLAEIQSDNPLKQNLIDHILIFENLPIAAKIERARARSQWDTPNDHREVKESAHENKISIHNSIEGKKENDSKKAEGALVLSRVEVFEQTNYDFNVVVTPGEQLVVRIDYNSHVFEKWLLERVTDHLERVLVQLVEDETLKIGDIIFLSSKEKRQVLVDFNDTTAKYPVDKTLHRLFEEQVERSPDNTVVDFAAAGGPTGRSGQVRAHTTLTYRELNKEANSLASVLIEKGVRPNAIVGLMIERSLEMVVAILGILKAGGAYLPIGPAYPEERKAYILKDSAAGILLTTANLVKNNEAWSNLGVEILFIDKGIRVGARSAVPGDMAYVIYTSGTTGRPKGVLVEHKGVVNYSWWRINNYNFGCSNITLESFSFTFDGFCCSFYPSLLSGGTLVMVPDSKETDFFFIKDVIKEVGVTNTIMVPAVYDALLDCAEENDLSSLKWVTLGGDEANINLLNKSRKKYPNLPVYNEYGPTETSIGATFYREYKDSGNTGIIGKPNANTRLYVLDSSGSPVPIGIPGELVIGGAGVTRGYLNRPGLTVEKFIDNEFSFGLQNPTCVGKRLTSPQQIPENQSMVPLMAPRAAGLLLEGNKLYKTGDLVRWLPDGRVEFYGRIDHQVKIRGFRIELGEIEILLQKHKQIKNAVITAKENEEGNKFLIAYIVSDSELSGSELREYLAKDLPDYMIPSSFVPLEKLPLNPHGKLDRNALPDPTGLSLSSETEYLPPRNEIEAMLVETWQKVLGREQIGIHDNFFINGGDSIKTIQINSGIYKHGYRIEMRDIFTFPTIAELAPKVRKLKTLAEQSTVTGIVPLTPIQTQFFSMNHPNASHFNQAVMFFSQNRFDEEAVKAVFLKILDHHDALRMTYEEIDSGIVQHNHGRDYPFSLQVYDLRDRKDPAPELEKRANEIQAGIDLEKGPLMKLGLFHLPDGDRLLIVIHHLVIDGVSWRILFEDIETLLMQYKDEETFNLPLKTHSFQTWAERLSNYANSEQFLEEKSFWTRFEDGEFPLIPADYGEGDNRIKDIKSKSFNLSVADTELMLSKVNEAFNTEINDILLTALGLTVRETYGHEKVLIAMEGHGREDILANVDISRTVGWFTSVYPVLLDVSIAEDLSRQIKEVKESLHKIPDKGVGYGILKYMTAPENKQEFALDLKPQIGFNYLGQFDSDMNRNSFTMAAESQGRSVDQEMRMDYDLVVTGILARQTLTISVQYGKKQFKEETIALFINNFHKQLKHIIAFCVSREEKEITPSDLTYDGLSIDTMESLSAMFDD